MILLGPPGAGKGTQASRIAESLSVPKVASGDLFRDQQARDTKLGRLARSYMETGGLVPDDVTIRIVMEWIKAHEGEGGFLLDGFPRTRVQAEALDREIVESGGIDRALYVNVSTKELVRRLAGRIICRSCQTPYHEYSSPPIMVGKCDRCGGDLYQRDDDKAEAVQKRLEVYFKETDPLVQFYREAGILREIDGEGTVEDVGTALLEAIER